MHTVSVLESGKVKIRSKCCFLTLKQSLNVCRVSILVSKDATKQASKLYEQVLKETASTVLLEIVLCMVSLIISLSIIFLDASMTQWVQVIISLFEYYLLFAMLLNKGHIK